MTPVDRSARTGFAINTLDRRANDRENEAFVTSARGDQRARFAIVCGDQPVTRKGTDTLEGIFRKDDLSPLGEEDVAVFLGLTEEGEPRFALGFAKARASTLSHAGFELADLRGLASRGEFEAALLGMIGEAKAICDWHLRHGFCAVCGSPTQAEAAGWRRTCEACKAQHFPRTDPVVIMLAVDGDRCLMGRQARFPPGMYSALAGFLEPGETMEDAVRREIFEEAGIRCSTVTYLASQPWPFPSSLMIGCIARAETSDLIVDQQELEDCRWFSRDEVRAMLDGSHPGALKAPHPVAIAHHLVKAFAEGEF